MTELHINFVVTAIHRKSEEHEKFFGKPPNLLIVSRDVYYSIRSNVEYLSGITLEDKFIGERYMGLELAILTDEHTKERIYVL